MPGPRIGPRPKDFNEEVLKQSPTYRKWVSLQPGETLRYACRVFTRPGTIVKTYNNDNNDNCTTTSTSNNDSNKNQIVVVIDNDDEERLLRRIMIARRNNVKDHETLKNARKIVRGDSCNGQTPTITNINTTSIPIPSASTTRSNGKRQRVTTTKVATTVIAANLSDPTSSSTETQNERPPPHVNANEDESIIKKNSTNVAYEDSVVVTTTTKDVGDGNAFHPESTAATLHRYDSNTSCNKKKKRSTANDMYIFGEMDVDAVEKTRSYRSWLELNDGQAFVYNQTYIKGRTGHDWLLRKNIWRRMRYRRENKKLVTKMIMSLQPSTTASIATPPTLTESCNENTSTSNTTTTINTTTSATSDNIKIPAKTNLDDTVVQETTKTTTKVTRKRKASTTRKTKTAKRMKQAMIDKLQAPQQISSIDRVDALDSDNNHYNSNTAGAIDDTDAITAAAVADTNTGTLMMTMMMDSSTPAVAAVSGVDTNVAVASVNVDVDCSLLVAEAAAAAAAVVAAGAVAGGENSTTTDHDDAVEAAVAAAVTFGADLAFLQQNNDNNNSHTNRS